MNFNIDIWIRDIKCAFIVALDESNVPLSYIDVSKKIGLNNHDLKHWFAMHLTHDLINDNKVEKIIINGKTKYKIVGKEYNNNVEVLEDLSKSMLKAKLREKGLNVGGNKEELIKRLKKYNLLYEMKEELENIKVLLQKMKEENDKN